VLRILYHNKYSTFVTHQKAITEALHTMAAEQQLMTLELDAKIAAVSPSSQHLITLLKAVGAAVAGTAEMLREQTVTAVHSHNAFGDAQLSVDVLADEIVFDELTKSGVCHTAASEECPEERLLLTPTIDAKKDAANHDASKDGTENENELFSVAFDPLDGSSIIGANFAVGAIFGVWGGAGLKDRKGSEQVAAVLAMYGPRTTMAVAVAG
jgi:sedoheptulose-bisphosphatase